MENSSTTKMSTEEIRFQRRENRRVKKIAKNLLLEEQKVLTKFGHNSEKLMLISAEALIKYQKTKNEPKRDPFNRKKFNRSIDLTDLIIRKNKTKLNKSKKGYLYSNSKSSNRLRGKQREINLKKRLSRLKKSIVNSRLARRSEIDVESGPVDNTPKDNSHDEVMRCLQNELKSLNLLNSTEPKIKNQNPYMYSRKFRGYCNNLTSPVLCMLTETLLRDIFRFQKRAYERNETRSRAHRRFVVGFKETRSFLSVDKIKLVIIAPDCEICDDLDNTINQIKSECEIRKIPYVFSLRRHQLRNALQKKTPISCVGVLNYDGAHTTFKQLNQVLHEERASFKKFFTPAESSPIN